MLTRQKILLSDISLDGTQGRERTHERYVQTYAEAMANGAVFPAIVLFLDAKGRHWIGDGWHRVYAAMRSGLTEIDAEVRSGTKRDAMLFNIERNKEARGIPLTDGDKRHAVRVLLTDKDCAAWTDCRIANYVGCTQSHVWGIRQSMKADGEVFPSYRVNSKGEKVDYRCSKGGFSTAQRHLMERVVDLKSAGKSHKEIAEELEIGERTVSKAVNAARRSSNRKCHHCNGTGWLSNTESAVN